MSSILYIFSVLHVLHHLYPPTSPFSSSPDTAENAFQSNLIHKNILAFQPPISTLLNLHFILCYCFNWYSTRSNPGRLWGFLRNRFFSLLGFDIDKLYTNYVHRRQYTWIIDLFTIRDFLRQFLCLIQVLGNQYPPPPRPATPCLQINTLSSGWMSN